MSLNGRVCSSRVVKLFKYFRTTLFELITWRFACWMLHLWMCTHRIPSWKIPGNLSDFFFFFFLHSYEKKKKKGLVLKLSYQVEFILYTLLLAHRVHKILSGCLFCKYNGHIKSSYICSIQYMTVEGWWNTSWHFVTNLKESRLLLSPWITSAISTGCYACLKYACLRECVPSCPLESEAFVTLLLRT